MKSFEKSVHVGASGFDMGHFEGFFLREWFIDIQAFKSKLFYFILIVLPCIFHNFIYSILD